MLYCLEADGNIYAHGREYINGNDRIYFRKVVYIKVEF